MNVFGCPDLGEHFVLVFGEQVNVSGNLLQGCMQDILWVGGGGGGNHLITT